MPMTTPIITTGDDPILPVRLKKNNAYFSIDSGATVKASVIDKDRKAILLAPVTVSFSEAGSDWGNSLLVIKFTEANTSNIPLKYLGSALLEIQVDDGGKLTWFHPIKIVQGTIDSAELIYTPPISMGSIVVGLIDTELGNALWQSSNTISEENGNLLIGEADTSLHYHSSDRLRTNHTGTQPSTTISDYLTTLAGTSNTTAFVPTLDYHPATKKYVDDNAGGAELLGPEAASFSSAIFKLVDPTTSYEASFGTSALTANRALTLPNFPFNFNSYFDSSGNIYASQLISNPNATNGSVYLGSDYRTYFIRPSTTLLRIYCNNSNIVQYDSSNGQITHPSNTKIGFTSGIYADVGLDTWSYRAAIGVWGFNGTIQQHDLTSGYAIDYDLTTLTADRIITYPNFPFNFSDYFASNGTIVRAGYQNGGGELISYQQGAGLYLSLKSDTGALKSGVFRSNADFIMYYDLSTGDVVLDATFSGADVLLKTNSISRVIVTDATTAVTNPFKFAEYTTAQRTALPNTANTTVYDTDLSKLYTNDGTIWNAHW